MDRKNCWYEWINKLVVSSEIYVFMYRVRCYQRLGDNCTPSWLKIYYPISCRNYAINTEYINSSQNANCMLCERELIQTPSHAAAHTGGLRGMEIERKHSVQITYPPPNDSPDSAILPTDHWRNNLLNLCRVFLCNGGTQKAIKIWIIFYLESSTQCNQIEFDRMRRVERKYISMNNDTTACGQRWDRIWLTAARCSFTLCDVRVSEWCANSDT